MKITLIKINDVYDLDKDENPILIKKNVRTKIHLDTRDIIFIEEVVNQNGSKSKTKCRIFIHESGPCTVHEKFEKIKALKERKEVNNPIGFMK